ncbi:hypothetical protein [Streptomyces sp. NPDC048248]|uniref:hypothetical protein n=1 Tax=Streptomyces sp. NPDC048248 TaxID=3365523 RepID=UPI00371D0BB0
MKSTDRLGGAVRAGILAAGLLMLAGTATGSPVPTGHGEARVAGTHRAERPPTPPSDADRGVEADRAQGREAARGRGGQVVSEGGGGRGSEGVGG